MDEPVSRTQVDEFDHLAHRLRKTLVSLSAVEAPTVENPISLDLVADGFEDTVPAPLDEPKTAIHRQLRLNEAHAAPDVRLRRV
jgi:hypothetical protein